MAMRVLLGQQLGNARCSTRLPMSQFPGRRFYSTEAEHDVVIIGGGPGGYVAAIKAGQLGLKTTCVEMRGRLGGTCLNVGCIPSKALLGTSHKYEDAKLHFAEQGINVGEVKIDVAQMMKTKDSKVMGLTTGIEGLFKKNKVGYEKGRGSITGPNEVTVELTEGGKKVLKAKNIVIATGSEVTAVPNITIDEKLIVSSTGALALTEVPKKMVVIGGGIIGLELGSVWARLGAEVTVIEFTGRIAAGADGEVAKEFQKILTKQKLKFMLNSKVTNAVVKGQGVEITVEDAKGGNEQKMQTDVVLVSVGRKPLTGNMGLKEVGVKVNERGMIPVDSQFRTNIASIRAIGDCIPGPMLAHKAEEDGIACIENIHAPGSGHVNYATVPSVIYTHPEVAWVGATEEDLKGKGAVYKIGKFPFKANSRARTNADMDGFVKFLADKETDKILGVHIIGPDAGELIAESVLAMEYGASSEDVARTCHSHPTLSEAVKEAAMATYGSPIHF